MAKTAAQTAWTLISIATKMACGARAATCMGENKLQFKVERRPYRFVCVEFVPGHYNVEYFRLKRGSFQKVSIQKSEGVLAGMLSELIRSMVNR